MTVPPATALAAASDPADPWIAPTTGYWQQFETAAYWAGRLAPPYHHSYPATLDDSSVLALPVRRLPGGQGRAVASLIANQASLPVVAAASIARARAVFDSPLLEWRADGWWPL